MAELESIELSVPLHIFEQYWALCLDFAMCTPAKQPPVDAASVPLGKRGTLDVDQGGDVELLADL